MEFLKTIYTFDVWIIFHFFVGKVELRKLLPNKWTYKYNFSIGALLWAESIEPTNNYA